MGSLFGKKQANKVRADQGSSPLEKARHYAEQESWALAIVQYRKHLKLETPTAEVYSELARAYEAAGKDNDAQAARQKAEELK